MGRRDKTGNRVLDEKATVAACQADRGTPTERANRAAEAREQQGQSQSDGNAAAKQWRGTRT